MCVLDLWYAHVPAVRCVRVECRPNAEVCEVLRENQVYLFLIHPLRHGWSRRGLAWASAGHPFPWRRGGVQSHRHVRMPSCNVHTARMQASSSLAHTLPPCSREQTVKWLERLGALQPNDLGALTRLG